MSANEWFELSRIKMKIESSIRDARIVIDKVFEFYSDAKSSLERAFDAEKEKFEKKQINFKSEEERFWAEENMESYFEEEWSNNELFLSELLKMLVVYLYSSSENVNKYCCEVLDGLPLSHYKMQADAIKQTFQKDALKEIRAVNNCLKHKDGCVDSPLHNAFPDKYTVGQKIELSFDVINEFYHQYCVSLEATNLEVDHFFDLLKSLN